MALDAANSSSFPAARFVSVTQSLASRALVGLVFSSPIAFLAG